MARPSRYEEIKDKLILIKGWAMDGLTNKQIAKNLGISQKTLYEWQNQYSEFREALKKGKEVANREVENALFKKATGYEYKETKVITNPDGSTRIENTIKHQAPDTTAAIFWLKNRKPDQWRDKQEVEHSGGMEHRISKDELLDLLGGVSDEISDSESDIENTE